MTVPLPGSFRRTTMRAGGVRINTLIGGRGSPVLLLHGYPQTHLLWHRVAPELAKRHTVVLTDLRGYGDSGKPAGGARHEEYAKRTMARDQVLVMRELGYAEFAVAGHDRGGRVGHRMALDYPQAVTRLAVVDIVPTRHAFANADIAFGLGYCHWFFLAQPEPLPEHMIGSEPAGSVRAPHCDRFSARRPRATWHPHAPPGGAPPAPAPAGVAAAHERPERHHADPHHHPPGHRAQVPRHEGQQVLVRHPDQAAHLDHDDHEERRASEHLYSRA